MSFILNVFRRLSLFHKSAVVFAAVLLLGYSLAIPVEAGTSQEAAPLPPLCVTGTQLTAHDGTPVQLRGISTHGIAWFPQYVNRDLFHQFHTEWKADVIRLAMYTAESGGYCTDGDQEYLKELLKTGIEAATEEGMYVILDWHILSDNDPNQYLDQAKGFFQEFSSAYADADNILYEICNEPNGQTTWTDIKHYALEVIPVIRANDPDAVIFVGTPNWSQFVDQAASDPITEYDNIMYTLHFYAATHREDLRSKMVQAVQDGLPVFVTEYGICDASGNGDIDIEEANQWVSTMDELKISYVNWNLSNKAESSAMLLPGCTKVSHLEYDDLSLSGRWLYQMLTGISPVGEEENNDAVVNPVDTGGFTVKTDSSLAVSAVKRESGMEEGDEVLLIDVTVTNMTADLLDGWSVQLEFPEQFTLLDSWNGTFLVDDTTLTITPKDYNRSIFSGESITDIGFIIK